MSEGNGDKRWESLRRQILFYSGLFGLFLYLVLVNILGENFHVEFLLAFLAMMGISIAWGIDRK